MTLNPLTLWGKLSPKMRYEIHSGVNTVIATMIFEFGVQIQQHQELLDPSAITGGLLVALGVALVRAAWKALVVVAFQMLGFKVPKPR